MCVITATELKENFGKYMKLAQSEEIEVTLRGQHVFTIVPKKEKLKKDLVSIFGCLPEEAFDDKSIERE